MWLASGVIPSAVPGCSNSLEWLVHVGRQHGAPVICHIELYFESKRKRNVQRVGEGVIEMRNLEG
jgi:hypothetical protein